MSNLTLLRTILRLKSLKITHFRFMHRDTELHLAVKPYKNGCRCPECGRPAGSCTRRPSSGGGRTWPSWACASCSGTPRKRSSARPTGACKRIPWGRAMPASPTAWSWRLCALCQIHDAEGRGRDPATADLDPLQPAAPGHHAGAPRAHHPRPDHARGRRDLVLQGPQVRPPPSTTWTGRGSCGSGPGKGRDTIDRFFNDWLSRGQKARVAWASCDMSPAYIGAITHHCLRT